MIAGARLELVDIETMTGEVGDALRARPARLNIVAMMAHAHTSVLPQLGLGRAVMTQQALDPIQRELLILLSARLDQCQYVWTQHRPLAEGLGATAAMLDAVEALDLSSASFDQPTRVLLRFGRQVIEGGEVGDEVFEQAMRHFSGGELVEAIIAIGYYMTMNRIATATQTPLEKGSAGRLMHVAPTEGRGQAQ